MNAISSAKHAARPSSVIGEDPQPGNGRAWSRHDWIGLAVFGAAAACTVVWLIILDRGDSFFYDEWDFINLAATTGYWHNLLLPHNGHPSMIPYSIYEALLHTVGLRHYGPYKWILFLLNVGCGGLLFLLLRRKINPVLAGALPAVLMLLGPSWQDILWPFQIGFLGSVAGGLGALVLIQRESKWAELGACLCLLASIGSSGVGLAFLTGVGVELLWRRRDWRRLWIPAIPSALFVVWYETIGMSSTTSFSLSSFGQSAATATATTVGALIAGGTTTGGVVACVLGALAMVAFVRSPARSARLAMALTGLLTFWILILVARGASPATPNRYLYPAAALVLVAVGELPSLITRGAPARLPASAPRWTRPVAVVAIVAYAGLAIWSNSSTLISGSNELTASETQVRTEQGALDLAGTALPPRYRPDSIEMPQVTVGPFLRAVSSFGSPGDSRNNIMASDEAQRSAIDELLLRGRPIRVTAAPDTATVTRCEFRHVGGGAASPTFILPLRGARITAPVGSALAVRVKSFSSTFPATAVATVAPGSTSVITWSNRSNGIRWEVELTPVPALAAPGSFAAICTRA